MLVRDGILVQRSAFTDYGLNTQDKDRDSGSDLKDEIRKIRHDLPIVLYSANYDEKDIKDSVKGFNDYLPKGETEKINERIPLWKEWALDYRRKRVSFAKQELTRLVEKYEISAQDIVTLRDFLPGADLRASDLASDLPGCDRLDDRTVNDILRDAGYRLRLIEPHTVVPGEDASESITKAAVPIWLRVTDNSYIVELYNHPCVYGDGETEKEDDRYCWIWGESLSLVDSDA